MLNKLDNIYDICKTWRIPNMKDVNMHRGIYHLGLPGGHSAGSIWTEWKFERFQCSAKLYPKLNIFALMVSSEYQEIYS